MRSHPQLFSGSCMLRVAQRAKGAHVSVEAIKEARVQFERDGYQFSNLDGELGALAVKLFEQRPQLLQARKLLYLTGQRPQILRVVDNVLSLALGNAKLLARVGRLVWAACKRRGGG